jgi:Flp pilus assembly protein TadD
MTSKHTLALAALTAALILLPGCASTPKQPQADTTADSNEPDLLAELHQRMASGKLQRDTAAENRAKPVTAAADTSSSPTVTADTAKQQAALAVAGDYARGLGLMAAGKDDEALALMRQIAARTPQFSGPLVNQAVILIRQQKLADAEQTLHAALKVNPRNPYAYDLLGVTLREQGKFTEAKTAYESALAIDPNYAKAHFNLGVLADLYLQDLPLALQHYERYQALQSKPDAAVAKWIIDLQKRTGVYKPPAPPPPAPAPAADAAEPAAQAAPGPAAAETASPAAPAAPADSPAQPAGEAK